MIKKLMIVAAAVMSLAASAKPDNAGIVEKALNVTERVNIAPETEKVVMFIDLGRGVWTVNAELNLFVAADESFRVYYASYLSFTQHIDYQNGRTAMGSEQIIGGRADIVVPLVGRRVSVDVPQGQTRRVYLLAWVHTRNGEHIDIAQTYGFAYAHLVFPNP